MKHLKFQTLLTTPPLYLHHQGMSVKECGHDEEVKKKLCLRLFIAFIGLMILAIFIVLLVWIILRPTKPHFVIQDATMYNFNISSPNFLTSKLQITLSSRNPNEKIGIYYDKINVYATYHSQQITLPTDLPPTYQGHKDTTVWSPFLYGNTVPVAPYLAVNLEQDEKSGTVMVNVRVDGRIRWKVGTFVTGRYHLYVNCPAYINFGNKNHVANKYHLIMDCHVDV